MEQPALPQQRSGGVLPPADTLPPPRTTPATTNPPAPHRTPEAASLQPLGADLEPALRHACQGRLSAVTWFRTDWQRGGALTGYATFQAANGQSHAAVVKLPVNPVELRWLTRLQDAGGLAPKLWAQGTSLGEYDLAWVVMERLPFGPLSAGWGGVEFDLLIQAAARFYASASRFPVTEPPATRHWEQTLERSRQNLRRHHIAHEQRWSQALKKAQRKLKQWTETWQGRPVNEWCHGDLHLGNAMTRHTPPQGPAVLLDYALVHPGNWVEDAVYFEHLFWARGQRLRGRNLCRDIAQERKRLGLPVAPDWPRLASVRRALLALSTPTILTQDGDPHHVQACLNVLEQEVG